MICRDKRLVPTVGQTAREEQLRMERGAGITGEPEQSWIHFLKQ